MHSNELRRAYLAAIVNEQARQRRELNGQISPLDDAPQLGRARVRKLEAPNTYALRILYRNSIETYIYTCT